MFKNIILSLLMANILFANTQEVNIYSHRHYDTDKQLYKLFEKKTGIKVNIVKATANELIKRLESEGKNSPADILITSDVARLYLAQSKNLLQKVDSKILEEIVPKNLRHKDGYWFALTKRARVIVYNIDNVDPSSISTYESLTQPEFKGKVLMRNSSNIYNQSLLASMIANFGEEKAKQWAQGMVDNFARNPRGNDIDQMKAVAAGMGDVAVVNTYYLGKLLSSRKFSEVAVGKKMGIVFPNQKTNGTHINISGAGVVKYSKNKENAVKLIEFLVSSEAQSMFAQANYEYPININVEPAKVIKDWGTFKEDSLSLDELGVHNERAVRIFNEVHWK